MKMTLLVKKITRCSTKLRTDDVFYRIKKIRQAGHGIYQDSDITTTSYTPVATFTNVSHIHTEVIQAYK